MTKIFTKDLNKKGQGMTQNLPFTKFIRVFHGGGCH